MRSLLCVFAAALAAAALSSGCEKAGSPTRFVTIGTGGVTGVYYPTGGAIARLVNAKRDTYHLRVSVESTGGSVFNINALAGGDLDFGIAQADRAYQAVHGQAEWKDKGPRKDLRAVCSLYPEMVTLVAAEDSGIRELKDMKGKRVNIGNPGSGTRGNAIAVIEAAGLDWEKDLKAEGLKASEAPTMLQDGRIAAFFYTVGHPSGAIKEATAGVRRRARFVPLTGMDKLIDAHPYYSAAEIPVKLYPKAANKKDVPTLGMKTVLLTSASVPDGVVYAVTKEIFENLDGLRKMHPALARLKKAEMLKGLSAPLHPGAARYYREAGLLK